MKITGGKGHSLRQQVGNRRECRRGGWNLESKRDKSRRLSWRGRQVQKKMEPRTLGNSPTSPLAQILTSRLDVI